MTITEDNVPQGGVGSRIGPYELTREAGRGGAATVYEALDTKIGRRVAVKVVRMPSHLAVEERRDMAERLMREARAAGRLSHPSIVTLHDVGSEDDVYYLVMEFLDGETLHQRLRRGPLPAADAARIAEQLASALGAVHAAGMLHRDIKPGNVMILPDGRIKLMDFGIARQLDETLLTQAGSFVGTPAYMSPEQCRGEDATAASDTWALGVLIYQMLAGHRPFEGATIPSVMYQVTHEDPPPISGVPNEARRIVAQALDKDPARRFATPAALADALSQAVNAAPEAATVEAEPETIWARPAARRLRLRPWPTAAAAAALLGAITLGSAHLHRPTAPSSTHVSVTPQTPSISKTAPVLTPARHAPAKHATMKAVPRSAAHASAARAVNKRKARSVRRTHSAKRHHRRQRTHTFGARDFFTLAHQLLG
ncbi:hypothetical protein CCAX7_53470 [Capsulimonas corticalis]|uniref:non-specific serine/threonine protein kinase n=1 Tax=Capsulimonas corticalis TaxID=2219043 RepID=A0A402CNS1_9BACT|nr:serine/threonine-protein kinase [Capsulimonas corticalis]BDI33296.1 hypothetical protein CCAX7_53470 [Capsulimonas corticalis]